MILLQRWDKSPLGSYIPTRVDEVIEVLVSDRIEEFMDHESEVLEWLD